MPLIPAVKLGGLAFADTLVIADDFGGELPLAQRNRGRKGIAGGAAKRAVQNYFSDKIRKGQAPVKAEALIAEVVEFVELLFEVRMGRTTAQDYIKGLDTKLTE